MMPRIRLHSLLPFTAACVSGLFLAAVPASAGVVFSESFEAPVVSGYDDVTVPSGGNWIGSTSGFGSTNRGLYNETFAWPATAAFSTPYGAQAYYLNYGGAGLTSAVGATGQTLTAGVTYKLSFNAAVAAGTASGTYQVELVAFGTADDNTSRANCTSSRPGTILATGTGTVTTTDLSTAASIVFTPAAGNAHLGKELGIRLIKSTNSVLYDNIRLVVGHDLAPSPASGVTVASGSVPLSWTNMPPNSGTDTFVDVWFGTNPAALSKVINAGPNTTTTTVVAPAAGTYYWRVDSYLNGSATGSPVTGDLFVFHVIDTDNDGLPDTYELANTSPSSATGLNPNDDLDNDGLTNFQEYTYGTGPNNPDTDGDSLQDGPEMAGAGQRPATSPLLADSDADGLSDAVETNTGIWAGTSNTGTNPVDADWDNDGLKDGVETRSGVMVGRTIDTGTDPYLADTDGDGEGDWYEVAALFTNPNSSASKGNVPYPLPDPDGAAGATDKPVKVYIMSGQSNMVGIGYVTGTAPGSLETIAKRENKFPNLVDASNNWTKRNDVLYKGVVTATAAGPLTAGQGSDSTRLGPELGFGQIMGWYHGEQVLILKASQGNRSLGWDFAPPGTTRFELAGYTYAAYGESPTKWLTSGGAAAPGGWYAGKQYDDCFLAESAMGCLPWAVATAYPASCQVRHNGIVYLSKSAHTSTAASEPGVGVDSATYWSVYSIVNAADVLNNGVLANLPTGPGSLNGRSYQIAGFVWWQGHKDQYDAGHYTRYETNLVTLINSLRAKFNAPNAPFVVGTIGFNGGNYATNTPYDYIYKAQKAISDPARHPEFSGTVKSVDTTGYWRTLAESPGTQDFHYNNNAETYMLAGDAMGRAMVELLQDTAAPTPNPMTFVLAPTAVNSTTVGMTAATGVDVSGPVEYFFENLSNGNNSGWITSTSWNNTGLTNAVAYDFHVKARDNKGNETGWSATVTAAPGNDVTAPAPDPMSFATPPTALGENAITMTATTAGDVSGVEYYFDCLTAGGHDSAWQDSPTYTDTGLSPGTQYGYQVLARDKSTAHNTTAASATATATTADPDSTAPTPNPMSFATPPSAQGQDSITMTATAASDVSGVEYFFHCLTAGGHDSGWQGSASYTDNGLSPSTQYSYQVRARDKSPLQNATAYSVTASATTDTPDTTPPSILSLNPADNATEVVVGGNLVLTFDEQITSNIGSVTLRNLTDSTETVFDLNDPQVIISGSSLTLNPSTNLLPGKTYSLRIDATALQDLAGNAFAGISDDTTWNFTTAVVPFVWTQTAGGAQAWTTGTNWLAGTAPSPLAGDTVDLSSANLTAATTLTLGADRSAQLWKFGDATTASHDWTVAAGNRMILAGATPTIQVVNRSATLNNVVDGTAGVVKSGGGTLVLANTANTYSGGTTVNGGTLNIAANGSLGTGTLTFSGTATLDGAASLTLSRGVTLNSGTSVTWKLQNATVSGALSGSGTFNCPTGDASGTTSFLSNANDFTGPILMGTGIFRSQVTVNSLGDGPGAGRIRLGSPDGYGLGTLTLGTGATAPLTLTYRQIDIASPGGTANLVNDNTANSQSNIITVNSDFLSTPAGSKTLVLGGANSGDNLIAGKIIDGSGTVHLSKTGAGKWLVTAANPFTGKTTVNQGTLSINSLGNVNGGASALGNPSSAANGVILLGNAGNTGTLVYTGAAASSDRGIQINSSNNTNTGGGSIQNNGSGALTFTASPFNSAYASLTSSVTRTLTLGGSNGGQIQGVLQDNSTTGKVALSKSGSGTWVLTAANTYSGATTLTDGTLLVNSPGSLAAASAVAVNGTGTLGGSGTIGGSVTLAATGSLAPGASAAGTLAIGGGLNLSAPANNGAGKLRFELGPISASDKVTVGGTLTLGSGYLGFSDFVFTVLPGLENGTYPLITSAALSGTLAGSGLSGSIGNGGSGLLRLTGTTLELVVSGLTGSTVSSPYDSWSGGAAFTADANNDGTANGLAWLLGAGTPGVGVQPPQLVRGPGGLVLSFDCLSAANRGTAALKLQYSRDLGVGDAWSGHEVVVPGAVGVVNDPGGVVFSCTANGALIHVEATIPASAANPGGKLFARLLSTP